MRDYEEIVNHVRMCSYERQPDGITGVVRIGGWNGSVVASWGGGWEHVSVAPYPKRITPSWDDMCTLKDMFFRDDEAVIQVHPPKAEYVDNVGNCLHIWRCKYKDMVLPPSIFVGLREGQTMQEAIKEVKEAYKLAGEEYHGI